jgi:predicted enzyme related to lactoylglutathione lyase
MPALSNASVGQIAVVVKDVERATHFYRDTLGLPHLFSANNMAFFQAGGTRLLLGLPTNEHPGPSSVLYFKVEDIDAACRELSGAGVRIIEQPEIVHDSGASQLWLAFFADEEGNTHALMEERNTLI